jgi:hypothetical protein
MVSMVPGCKISTRENEWTERCGIVADSLQEGGGHDVFYRTPGGFLIMINWSQDVFAKAWGFATKAHHGQTYGGSGEQLADSLTRIREQPREIWMVKLADRIINLYQPPFYWNSDKMLSYQSEAMTILNALAPGSEILDNRLQQKINGYSQFLRT